MAGIEIVLKIIVYFVHERAWGLVPFGFVEVKPAVFCVSGPGGRDKERFVDSLKHLVERKGYHVELLDPGFMRDFFGSDTGDAALDPSALAAISRLLARNGVCVIWAPDDDCGPGLSALRQACDNVHRVHVAGSGDEETDAGDVELRVDPSRDDTASAASEMIRIARVG